MTGGWIFYMFIHLNFMAGVLLKCCSAAYINPLRLGSDRLGHHHQSLVINHHMFIHLCVFTRPVSIYLTIIPHPASLLPFLLLASPSSVPFFPCHPTPTRLSLWVQCIHPFRDCLLLFLSFRRYAFNVNFLCLSMFLVFDASGIVLLTDGQPLLSSAVL